MKNGIIAFCGSKGSGKSTSASIFKQLYTGPTEELAFAGHLKEVCSKVFNVDMKYFINPDLKEKELDNYVTLNRENIEAVLKGFYITDFAYDKHVRGHITRVFDTPRTLLQYIGTEVLHPLDPLIHVKTTLRNKDPNKLSVITDLRFTQEFNFMKERIDFLPIYVQNNKAEMSASSDPHPSERQLLLFKDFCQRMENNGDLTSLTDKLKKVIKENYA